MKDFFEIYKEHRSVRTFNNQPVEEDLIDEIKEALNRTASSVGLQMSSVIRIKDSHIKEEIAKICKQDYINKAPELWIFIVDVARTNRLVQKQAKLLEANTGDIFFQAFTDACLMAAGLSSLVEYKNLGGVYLGSILNDQERMISLLKLPKGTFPVVGYAFGYKAEDGKLRPRLNTAVRFFTDSYIEPSAFDDMLEEYDKLLLSYYQEVKSPKAMTFTELTTLRLENINQKRNEILNNIKKQGFNL